MNPLDAYADSLWLCEPIRLQRAANHVAIARPCPSATDVRAAHREAMLSARTLVGVSDVYAMRGALVDGRIAVMAGSGAWDQVEESLASVPMPARAEAPRAIRPVKGKKVGVIPVFGPLEQRTSSELMKAGGTGLDFVSAAFDSLMANPGIGAVVLAIDSPGGSSYGAQELSDKIFNARGQKPIYAIADSMAASLAYWLASSADMVAVTPGGDVGSVGAYILHLDKSAALEAEGVKVSVVSAGKFKTELSPYAPLSDEATAFLQSRVDDSEGKFHAALKRNMDVSMDAVRNNFGKGRLVPADKAVASGMAHRVVSFEALIAKLTGGGSAASGGGGASSRGPSAEVLRMRHAQRKRAWAG